MAKKKKDDDTNRLQSPAEAGDDKDKDDEKETVTDANNALEHHAAVGKRERNLVRRVSKHLATKNDSKDKAAAQEPGVELDNVKEKTPEPKTETVSAEDYARAFDQLSIPSESSFRLENFVLLTKNPYAGIAALLALFLGLCIGCSGGSRIDPVIREIGSTANEDNTTLNIKTSSGDYEFQFANNAFKGNILTDAEYQLVREREAVVATQAKADALRHMSDLIRAQTDVATAAAARAAAESSVATARYISEQQKQQSVGLTPTIVEAAMKN